MMTTIPGDGNAMGCKHNRERERERGRELDRDTDIKGSVVNGRRWGGEFVTVNQARGCRNDKNCFSGLLHHRRRNKVMQSTACHYSIICVSSPRHKDKFAYGNSIVRIRVCPWHVLPLYTLGIRKTLHEIDTLGSIAEAHFNAAKLYVDPVSQRTISHIYELINNSKLNFEEFFNY